VWNTLVGYERLPEFIPDMAMSRTLRRDGDCAVVEQHGRTGLGPFKRDFSLTLAVQEVPLHSVTAHAVAGDFRRFESSYWLRNMNDGSVRIDYAALIEPKAGIPSLVGVPVMQHAIRRQFDALVTEIGRRAAAR
jgi:ribosome-associated toxin RatA of RatAB toxin-antitoxin module